MDGTTWSGGTAGTREYTTTAASSGGAPSECQSVPDFGNVDNTRAYHTNNVDSLILILGRLKDKARNWFHQHPYLRASYDQNKFRFWLITTHLVGRGLPDFVIIGAMKSGTTSLYRFIVKHPAIVPAAKKEVHYFSIWYKFGELWYRSHFPTNLSRHYFYKRINQKLLWGSKSGLSFSPDGSRQDEGAFAWRKTDRDFAQSRWSCIFPLSSYIEKKQWTIVVWESHWVRKREVRRRESSWSKIRILLLNTTVGIRILPGVFTPSSWKTGSGIMAESSFWF